MDKLALTKEASQSLNRIATFAMNKFGVPSEIRMQLIEDFQSLDERNYVALKMCFGNLCMRMGLTHEEAIKLLNEDTSSRFIEFCDLLITESVIERLETFK
jgi:hypothetical protein